MVDRLRNETPAPPRLFPVPGKRCSTRLAFLLGMGLSGIASSARAFVPGTGRGHRETGTRPGDGWSGRGDASRGRKRACGQRVVGACVRRGMETPSSTGTCAVERSFRRVGAGLLLGGGPSAAHAAGYFLPPLRGFGNPVRLAYVTQTDRSWRPGGPEGNGRGRKPPVEKQLDQEPRRGERSATCGDAWGANSFRPAGAQRYKSRSTGSLRGRLFPSAAPRLREPGPFGVRYFRRRRRSSAHAPPRPSSTTVVGSGASPGLAQPVRSFHTR